jgi:hypothetical protein
VIAFIDISFNNMQLNNSQCLMIELGYPDPGVINTGTSLSKLWSLETGTVEYGHESRGTALLSLSSNPKLQTRPLVREVPRIIERRCRTILSDGEKEKLFRVLDGGLIPRQTGRLIVGRKIYFTLRQLGVGG